MAHPPLVRKTDLEFSPRLDEFFGGRMQAPYTALAGANNSGKSLVLKWLKATVGRTAHMIGVNRFYHVYHIGSGLRQENEIDQFESQFQQQFWQEQFNHESNFIDLNRIIVNLNDDRRNALFSLCGELLNTTFGLRKVDPANELSPWYIDVGGQNISVASSGTRLLTTILGICMDERFSTVLVDEPELGLGPRIQSPLAMFFQDAGWRRTYFPHLERVLVATHSQLFLDRSDIRNNFIVSKEGRAIRLQQIETIGECHRLQFNLLGNALETLFVPSAFVIVEGKSDLAFVQRLLELRFPGRNVAVLSAQGDIKRRVVGLRDLLGDFAKSPYRDRIFAVLDSVHPSGLVAELQALGLGRDNIIVWNRNGIEFCYPPVIVGQIYACSPERAAAIVIEGDVASLNGIAKRKAELAIDVTARMSAESTVPAEVETKLLTPLRQAID